MLDIVVHLITAGVVNLMVSPASQVCKKGGQKSMRLLCCKPSSNVIIIVGSKKNSAVGHSFVCIISVSITYSIPASRGPAYTFVLFLHNLCANASLFKFSQMER